MTRAIEILRELVAIPSVSPISNRAVMEAAARVLSANGWDARLLPYQDLHNVEKVNLIDRKSVV